GDLIARGRLAIAGHDHAVAEADGEHRGAVDRLHDVGEPLRFVARNEMRRCAAQHIDEAGIRVVLEQRPPALVHRHIPDAREMLRSRSAAVGDSVRSWRMCAFVLRSGSSMKIFFSGPSLKSKITESQLAETISSA